jgi:hypothetical protein
MAIRKVKSLEIAEVGAFKRRSTEDLVRRTAALIEIIEIDPEFAASKKEFDAINLFDGRDFLVETYTYDVVIVHSVLSPSLSKRLGPMPSNKELMTSPDNDGKVWVNRLVSTGAKYIVVCEGQPYTLSGLELGDLPGYNVLKQDRWLTVYKKA